MEKEEIAQTIVDFGNDLQENIVSVYRNSGVDFGNERYNSWRNKVRKFLDENLVNESTIFNSKKSPFGVHQGYRQAPEQSFMSQDGNVVLAYLASLAMDIEEGSYESPEIAEVAEENNSESIDSLKTIVNLCNRFHKVVKQHRHRREDRPTLDVNDEYDVQDLLHSLLQINFEDIRAEEWVPSNGAMCTRVDFLLKNEGIVIEVKKTRSGLSGKEVASQLIEDIHRYQSHPDCNVLVCFVYDPEERITNPRGIERDLSKSGEFEVHVLIRP